MRLQVERVPTKANIADLPSREEYQLLEDMGAQLLLPKWSEGFLKPCSWNALRLDRFF